MWMLGLDFSGNWREEASCFHRLLVGCSGGHPGNSIPLGEVRAQSEPTPLRHFRIPPRRWSDLRSCCQTGEMVRPLRSFCYEIRCDPSDYACPFIHWAQTNSRFLQSQIWILQKTHWFSFRFLFQRDEECILGCKLWCLQSHGMQNPGVGNSKELHWAQPLQTFRNLHLLQWKWKTGCRKEPECSTADTVLLCSVEPRRRCRGCKKKA